MSLVTWSPFKELDDFFDRYNTALGRSFATGRSGERSSALEWRPAANISETEKEYLIKAELPEVPRDDVEVTVQDGVITIKGERRFEKTDDSEQQHRIESFYGSFARSFSLPSDVDAAHIHAESKDGMLTVHLPKAEVEKAKSIEIKVR
jgi:HSP20 family protein